MLLDNYYKWRGAVQAYSHLNTGARDVGLIDQTGASASMYFNYTQNSSFNSYALDNYVGIVVSSEAGAISGSDYALANDITSSFTSRTSSYTFSTIGDKLTRYLRRMFYNGGEADLTIAQIGVVKTVLQSTSSNKNILIFKKNLEQSIVVPVGETVVLSAEWTDIN